MKKISSLTLGAILLSSLALLLPLTIKNQLLGGQLVKQVAIADLTYQFSLGSSKGLFALKNYHEIYQPHFLYWAEEFPLFIFSALLLHKGLAFPLLVSLKIVSYLGLLALLHGCFLISRKACEWHQSSFQKYWPLLIALFPVFRIYAVTIMPDIWMMAGLAYGYYFLLRERYFLSGILIALATLFKFYGALGLVTVTCYFLFEKTTPRIIIKRLSLYAFTLWPILIYMFSVWYFDIGNSVLSNTKINFQGHLFSVDKFFSWGFWSRLATWNLNKNPTLLGALLIVVSLFSFRFRHPQEKSFLLALLVANSVFSILFCNGVYIHDYYGLHLTFFLSYFPARFLGELLESSVPKKKWVLVYLYSSSY